MLRSPRIPCVFALFSLISPDWILAGEPTLRVEVSGDILEIPMERYLAGVVTHEVDPAWTDPLLKTQAVLARTYAYRKRLDRLDDPFHLQSTTQDQVFGDPDKAPPQVLAAIKATRGEMILYDGQPIQAFYHSTCGGHTENAAEAFWPLPYAKGIADRYCMESPRSFWKLQMSLEAIADRLDDEGIDVGRPIALEVLDRNVSDRVSTLIVRGPEGFRMISGKDFRRIIGYTKLRSAHFELRADRGDVVKFLGAGSGHGVGVCQWGAKVMAEKGFGYKEIIGYYYQGVTVEKVY